MLFFVEFAIKLTLWIIAYTVGIVRISVAVFLMTKKREPGDLWKIGFLLAFALCIISLSNMETLRQSGFNSNIFGILATFGAAMITITLPNYMIRMIEAPSPLCRNVRIVSICAACFSLLSIIINIFYSTYIFSLITLAVTIGFMIISILYSMILLSGRKTAPIAKIMAVFVFIMIPLMVYFDFIRTEAQFYVVLPVMYLGVNILMIWEERMEFSTGSIATILDIEKMSETGLTSREQEVAVLLVQGQTYRNIADQLCISLETVKTHVSKIYAKTGSGNKMELLQKLGN